MGVGARCVLYEAQDGGVLVCALLALYTGLVLSSSGEIWCLFPTDSLYSTRLVLPELLT